MRTPFSRKDAKSAKETLNLLIKERQLRRSHSHAKVHPPWRAQRTQRNPNLFVEAGRHRQNHSHAKTQRNLKLFLKAVNDPEYAILEKGRPEVD